MDENNRNIKPKRVVLVLILIFLIFMFGIPIVIAVSAKNTFFAFAPGEVDAWISFWGSYLGGIVGMLAVLLTTFVLIKEQKKSVDEAAELNDKNTREREYKLLLIKINEELLQSLIHMTKLIKLRHEVFIKIKNIGQEIKNLEPFKGILMHQNIFHESNLKLIMEIKQNKFRESEILNEIDIEIAKIRILYARLDFDRNEIQEIDTLIEENKQNMIELVNRREYGETFDQILEEFDIEVTKIINEVSTIQIDKIKVLFEEYKK